jgi:hypothetical protein
MADDYLDFIRTLPALLDVLRNDLQAVCVELTYTLQAGRNAGKTFEHKSGDHPSSDFKSIEISTGFDRPLGALRITKPQLSERDLQAATQLTDLISYRTWILKEQYCFSVLQNSGLLNQPSQKTNYSGVAAMGREALSCTGFVIWRLCYDRKLKDGSFAVVESGDMSAGNPAKSFLRVEGSSPSEPLDMGLKEGIASFILESGKNLRIEDLLDPVEVKNKTSGRTIAHRETVERNRWRSGVFVPLFVGHRIIGVVGAYGPRPRGFNNLDVAITERIANSITSLFLFDESKQRNNLLFERIAELGKEIAGAQYTVFGSVHDAVNNSRHILDHIQYIKPTKETEQYYDIAKEYATQNVEILGKVRDKVRNPKTLPVVRSLKNVKEVVEQKIKQLRVEAKLRKIDLVIDVPDDFNFPIDEFRLSIILYNLIQNSMRHFSGVQRSRKLITLKIFDRVGGMVIELEDNATGIDPEVEPKIWEAFVSTTGGMGLGLSIAKTFAEELGGRVSHKTQWGKFAQFTFVLPRIN